MGDFSIDVSICGGAATVVVTGELDLASVPLLMRELDQLGDRVERRVTIDLAGITFIDSTGLQALVAAHNDMLERNREVIIGSCSPAAVRVFALIGLSEMLSDDCAAST